MIFHIHFVLRGGRRFQCYVTQGGKAFQRYGGLRGWVGSSKSQIFALRIVEWPLRVYEIISNLNAILNDISSVFVLELLFLAFIFAISWEKEVLLL